MNIRRLFLAGCAFPLLAWAQNLSVTGSGQNAFLGSIPQQDTGIAEYALSLRDAVTRGLKFNLGTELSGEAQRISRAQRLIELSRLLPNVGASLRESSQ